MADMKVQIEARNRFFYPDVMVTCGPRDQATATYKCFPTLVVERCFLNRPKPLTGEISLLTIKLSKAKKST